MGRYDSPSVKITFFAFAEIYSDEGKNTTDITEIRKAEKYKNMNVSEMEGRSDSDEDVSDDYVI